MAGIGFELRRILREESYTGVFRSYGYAALLSSGPWIISILSIVGLSFLLKGILDDEAITLVTATITHVYAFSLILVGPVQLVLVRFAADRFSDGKIEEIFPSFLSALLILAVMGGAFGLVFFGMGLEASMLYRAAAAGLMVYVACVFVTSLYLSALRDYRRILVGFAVGYGLSAVLSYIGGCFFGVEGVLLGFAAGHVALFLCLFGAFLHEHGERILPSWKFTGYFLRFPSLLLCGLLYNLGIWIDKFMFWWFSSENQQVNGWIFAAPSYDVGIYLGLLSIVPGMAVFFLKVETDFAERFAGFFELIEKGGSLRQILAAREEMTVSLRNGFILLFKVQAVITVLLVVFADQLVGFINIGAVQLGIFRVTLFGAFLLVVFLSLLTILFYFDDRKGALLCTGVFVLANAIASGITLMGNEAWFGFGFVVAAGLAMLIAGRRVNARVENLEYDVFSH